MGLSGSKNSKSKELEKLGNEEEGAINYMAMSEDHSILVSGNENGEVSIWITASIGEETESLRVIDAHESYITCITMFEAYVITASDDNTIKKWLMSTGECEIIFSGHKEKVNRIICNGDFIFSTSFDKTAKAWVFSESSIVRGEDDGEESEEEEDEEDDKIIAGECIRTFEGHTRSVQSIAYIPGETTPTKGRVIEISPDDIIVTGSADGTAKSWSFLTGQTLNTFKGHKGTITCLAVDPEGTTLYTGSSDKTIKSWDLRRGKPLKVLAGHTDPVISLFIINQLMFSGSQDGTVRCWVRGFEDCTHVYTGARHSVTGVQFHKGHLYTVSGDCNARVYDAKTGKLKMVYEGHSRGIQCMAIAEQKLYTGSSDGTIRVWDISSFAKLEERVPEKMIREENEPIQEENIETLE